MQKLSVRSDRQKQKTPFIELDVSLPCLKEPGHPTRDGPAVWELCRVLTTHNLKKQRKGNIPQILFKNHINIIIPSMLRFSNWCSFPYRV